MRLSEFRCKEVINACSCKRLGHIEDLEFDEKSGKICAVVIPGQGRCFGLFGKEEEYVIPYHCIKQIGEDIILVEVDENTVRKG
jgi:YlmC/YmxH family sporulation protein